MRGPACADPFRLTSPRTAGIPRKDRNDRAALHEQADARVGAGIEEQHAGTRRDIRPPPWRGTPRRVGNEISKASSRLHWCYVGHPLLITLNCVAADSGLLRVVRLHAVEDCSSMRENTTFILVFSVS